VLDPRDREVSVVDNALSLYGTQYTAKQSFFKFLGASFRIYAPDGRLQFYVKQKAFKLKEDITVFGDEAATKPLLSIRARSIMDFRATYDVTDVATGERIGAMKREGVRSTFLRDEWAILGTDDQKIGEVIEDSMVLALLRRFLLKLIPQTFHVRIAGKEIGTVAQAFNPIILTYRVDFSQAGALLDPRMGVAMVVLLLAIEGQADGAG
jgi:uncharacterized protein YxjI